MWGWHGRGGLVGELESETIMPAGTWIIETVADIANSLSSPTIAIDSSGRLHVAYRDIDDEYLKYALKDAGAWSYTTIDATGDNRYPSIAVDSGDYPHIAYYNSDADDLEYAYQDVGGWNLETVASGGDVGRQPSIAIDGNDFPHISYQDFTNRDLRYAEKTGGAWNTVLIHSASVSVGIYSSIAMDSNDYPHISYMHLTSSGPPRSTLRYAHKDIGGWSHELILTDVYTGHTNSIAIDSSDVVHISCVEDYREQLKYSVGNTGSWSSVVIDTSVSLWCDIALFTDEPQISYQGGNQLRYAYHESGSWNLEVVTAVSPTAQQRIAIDSGGQPHIVYANDNNIMHAYKAAAVIARTYFFLA